VARLWATCRRASGLPAPGGVEVAQGEQGPGLDHPLPGDPGQLQGGLERVLGPVGLSVLGQSFARPGQELRERAPAEFHWLAVPDHLDRAEDPEFKVTHARPYLHEYLPDSQRDRP
jgi:hypothetical protein